MPSVLADFELSPTVERILGAAADPSDRFTAA